MNGQLNSRVSKLVGELLPAMAEELQIKRCGDRHEARVWDAGIDARGGLEAGRRIAEICMAGLGAIHIVPSNDGMPTPLSVSVHTDHPVAGCMAAQYAGWKIHQDGYFAMGSGPMRAAAGTEALYDRIGFRESPQSAVGVLEADRLPPPSVVRYIAEQCRIAEDRLTLFVAPCASLAGSIQVVARSVETALHKMLELGFDLSQVVSGWGVAPLPPVARDPLVAIGRTNDAILYGARVVLWVAGDDRGLGQLIPQIPSCASAEHGHPFAEIFARHGNDFYAIDPHLFAPAMITLINVSTGNSFRSGKLCPEVMARSCGTK